MEAEMVDRMAILVGVRRFHGMSQMSGDDSRSLRCDNYVRMQHFVRRNAIVPFRRFWGDVCRKFMQRLFVALHGTHVVSHVTTQLVIEDFHSRHGTLVSYLRDALNEGSADAVAFPSCFSGLGFFLFSSICLVASIAFSCKNFIAVFSSSLFDLWFPPFYLVKKYYIIKNI
jgi:hypothetical protein